MTTAQLKAALRERGETPPPNASREVLEAMQEMAVSASVTEPAAYKSQPSAKPPSEPPTPSAVAVDDEGDEVTFEIKVPEGVKAGDMLEAHQRCSNHLQALTRGDGSGGAVRRAGMVMAACVWFRLVAATHA